MRLLLVLALLLHPGLGCAADVPSAAPPPEAALEELAADLRRGEFVGAFDRLTPEAQRRIVPLVEGLARFAGLETADAPTREVVAALAERLESDAEARAELSRLRVEIEVAGRTDDGRSIAAVRVDMAGQSESAEVTLELRDGAWRVHEVSGLSGLLEARLDANETAAIATLRLLVSAQAQFQAVGVADGNGNGVGEYGFFGELSGAVDVRGGGTLTPPVLSEAFRRGVGGTVTRSGYHFRIFLPDARGAGVTEADGVERVDPGNAEAIWWCYAWPVAHGVTGTRTFFVNQWGDIGATTHPGYGDAQGPAATAAALPAGEGEPTPTLASEAALDATGHDGRTWRRVN